MLRSLPFRAFFFSRFPGTLRNLPQLKKNASGRSFGVDGPHDRLLTAWIFKRLVVILIHFRQGRINFDKILYGCPSTPWPVHHLNSCGFAGPQINEVAKIRG